MTLCEIFSVHQTDKNTVHSYGEIYESLLAPLRDTATAVLEFGVLHGNSLRAWRDYFPHARVYGIDNYHLYMISGEARIETLMCDLSNDADVMATQAKLPELDLIVDDASHLVKDQVWSIAAWWKKLKPGGVYVVEDVPSREALECFRPFRAELIDRREVKDRYDDLMVILRK